MNLKDYHEEGDEEWTNEEWEELHKGKAQTRLITVRELNEVLAESKRQKAPGPDDLPMEAFKEMKK